MGRPAMILREPRSKADCAIVCCDGAVNVPDTRAQGMCAGFSL